MQFVCYSKCSTCKKAQNWLDEHDIDYNARDIKANNPNAEEIKAWYEKAKLPLKRFFNTSGVLYRELNLKDRLDEMSEEEKIELLASDGMLVKRPMLIMDEIVLVGFKIDQWEKALL